MKLRHKSSNELFSLYDAELILRIRNERNLEHERRLLSKFHEHLNSYPPSPELAKGFLSLYSNRKPRTLARYAATIKSFMKWYGEAMDDFKVKIPKTLPPYTEDSEVERLLSAIGNKRSHKSCIIRDTLITELALKTGLRRSELANLEAKDIHPDFLVVRNGKGGKDRIIPLVVSIAQRLKNFTQGMKPEEKVFKLKAECISNKVRQFAKKAGLNDFHTHTMRHKFATDLLEHGANIKQVQELLGHDNLATTEVYLSTTDQGKREAINRLDQERPDTESQKTIEGIRKRQAII
ncbi:tyrosine-type recombinase/integrase [Chloroflexota bacterium]